MTSVLVPLFFALSIAPVQQKSIWTEMNLKRTGGNGYEDYLDAVDEFRKSAIGPILLDRVRANRLNPTDLQLCRIIAERMRPVLSKIEQGNAKRVFEPVAEFDSKTTFPQYSVFKDIVKAVQASMQVDFAAGSTSSAIRQCLSTMQFVDNTSRGVLISSLMGIALQQIAFATLSRNWGQLSVPDALKIEQFVNQFFLRPNGAIETLRFEFCSLARMLRHEMPSMKTDDLKEWIGSEDDPDSDGEQFLKQWGAVPASQRHSICNRAATELLKQAAEFERILLQPEKAWVAPEFPTIGGMEGQLIEIVSPLHPLVLNMAARNRTQMRLLRLHAVIRQYRFEHDRLPESLARLNKPLEIQDPLAGESFIYEPKADLTYELYSKGSQQTGRIDLVMKRQPGEEQVDPNTPPSRRIVRAKNLQFAHAPQG